MSELSSDSTDGDRNPQQTDVSSEQLPEVFCQKLRQSRLPASIDATLAKVWNRLNGRLMQHTAWIDGPAELASLASTWTLDLLHDSNLLLAEKELQLLRDVLVRHWIGEIEKRLGRNQGACLSVFFSSSSGIK